MLKFRVFESGRAASSWPLRNGHLIGADGNAMRAEVLFEPGMVMCEKREVGTAALALQHDAGEVGELTLQTTLLPEREEPYLLSLELARHRLMIVFNKLEDWGMFDLDPDGPVMRRVELARRLFVEALCLQGTDPPRAAAVADDCLRASIDASEELAVANAEALLERRENREGRTRRTPVGVGVALNSNAERVRQALSAHFDFVQLPMKWKSLTPEEHEYRWGEVDEWLTWAGRHKMPVVAGPLVHLAPDAVPDWLYIWEHDYDTLRELMYEHVERVVEHARDRVHAWNVVAGLHVNRLFHLNFEQIMDLTRMTTMLVKKLHPSSKVIVEVEQPFGEYYATNTKSIPPLMYADLLVQSAIEFDALQLRLHAGQALPGQHARDLMQVAAVLDTYAGFGKPLHMSLAVPSEPVTAMMITPEDGDEPVDDRSGYWRKPWSPLVQERWLAASMTLAVSRPYVEAVAWSELADHPEIDLPLSGLMDEALRPKPALRRIANLRRRLMGDKAAEPPAPSPTQV